MKTPIELNAYGMFMNCNEHIVMRKHYRALHAREVKADIYLLIVHGAKAD